MYFHFQVFIGEISFKAGPPETKRTVKIGKGGALRDLVPCVQFQKREKHPQECYF